MNSFALRLLGAIQLADSDNQDVPFRSRRAVALLVYLIVQNRPIPRPQLVELIWPDKTEKQGRGNLRWALSYLAGVLPDAIQRTRHTVHFELPPDGYVDLLSIQAALAEKDYSQLERLLLDVQGEFLAGFYFDESAEYETWLITQRETWRLKMFAALETLIERHDAAGDYAGALVFAEKWLAFEPWEERAHRWAMTLLARLGRNDAALEQYERCWRLLAEELGTEPTDETTALYQRLLASGNQARHNLPAQPNELVGRSADVDRVMTLLHQHSRLVTIVGAGGMGKTRLAIAAASQVVEQFLDGVLFVDLTGLANASSLGSLLLQTLRQHTANTARIESNLSAEDQLVQALSDRNMLLVLDNMEHLLAGVPLLLNLLQHAPRTQFLVTSRERLNVRWEALVEIDGLSDPEAFDLFVQAASRQRPSFVVDTENRLCIERICALTAGMPLAIELAAVWTRLRTCHEIALAINDNLDFLSSRQRDLPDRHRSVRAAFEHSWQRLLPTEQQTLTRLTQFKGGFSADAAQQVADASWANLAPLVDKSLLRQRLHRVNGRSQVRYDMHPLLRQFSAEKQHEPSIAGRHAAYFAHFLNVRNTQIQQGDATALDDIQREIGNIRVAWEFCIDQVEQELLSRMVVPLGYFFDMRCRWTETVTLYQQLLDQLNGIDPTILFIRAVALATIGNAHTRLMQFSDADSTLTASLTLFQRLEQTEGIMFCLFALARVAHYNGSSRQAIKLYEQSYELATELDDLIGMARANINRADIAFTTGNYATGERLAKRALSQFEQFGDQRGIAVALLNLGRGDIAHNRLAQAIERARESARLAAEVGATQVHGHALCVMGQAQFYAADLQAAESTLHQAYALFSDIGADAPVVQTWSLLARLALARGDAEQAAQLTHRVQTLSKHLDYAEGMVWGDSLMGELALARGELVAAKNALRHALQRAHKLGHTPLTLDIVALMARVFEQEDDILARSMFGLVKQHPASGAILQSQVATHPTDESPPSLKLLLPTLLTG